jgi:hypothetical protein
VRITFVVSGSWTPLTTEKVNFIIKYLHEYGAICKMVFTHGSETQIELFDVKTGGQKSRHRVPTAKKTIDLVFIPLISKQLFSTPPPPKMRKAIAIAFIILSIYNL